MSKLGDGLKNLADKIGDAIDDLASLEVTTYTGDFTLTFSDFKEQGDSPFKVKSLLDSTSATLESKLDLVAYSRFEIDSDASNIVKSNLTSQDQTLIQAHQAMVQSAMEARKATFEMITNMVGLKLD
ncbi:hypothetical protein BXY85_2853 [Roseivirga pacifica]|jgi:hypothetical protein|uniref:Uncharacterized protein n=1 Tax=Roseivirga pacifica TaxID=1267423 RepID=A0A1I0R0J5_9BACT|nr:hypothetical protein [Roseivirga pacifica]MCO6357508.1 hypothetical protein [Roseivirga pacifica]MCO6367727.1 hypothetical protein [Roseivirga pacifica]MCO6369741.1 hypothetical protein [Roseivirga pacifica]MCO6373595.1 hypothetical protein [Roseivirga pacifica]MCO6377100.1 hypothetical protein [Roseivirga pacifica]